jgi:RHS repeat-associated protein
MDIVPHAKWRGINAAGRFISGDSLQDGFSTNQIGWPGYNADAWHAQRPPSQPSNWFGSLIADQRAASGMLYRRNRVYDPATGRFTQEDPIGIAGGLNTYGFAGGDPVNYSDPYGLKCRSDRPHSRDCLYMYQLTTFLFGRTTSEARYFWHHPLVAAVGGWTGLAWTPRAGLGGYAGWAAGVAEQLAPRDRRLRNNIEEAARHQVWQCQLAQEFGGQDAAGAANAHEANDAGTADSRRDQANNR